MTSSNEFETYLINNTNLLPSTIIQYSFVAKKFEDEYETISQQTINEFVAEHTREKHNNYYRAAMIRYLNFKQASLYAGGIPKCKRKPRKRLGTYLNHSQILEILENIKDERFRDMATLQDATGAREREVFTIKNNLIDFEKDVIKIRLEAKGAKERLIFLTNKYKPLILKYYSEYEYLFLPDEYKHFDTLTFERTINSLRVYYSEAVANAAAGLGHSKFTTHDIRRNWINDFMKKNPDINKVKQMAGHSHITTTLIYLQDNPQQVRGEMLDFQNERA